MTKSRLLLDPDPDSPCAASHLPDEGNVAASRLAKSTASAPPAVHREAVTPFKAGDRVRDKNTDETATVMARDPLHWCALDRTPVVYDDEDFIRHCPTDQLEVVND